MDLYKYDDLGHEIISRIDDRKYERLESVLLAEKPVRGEKSHGEGERYRRENAEEENPWRPFCSEKCKLIDLGKWVSEEYRIEGEKAEAEQSAKSNEQKS